MGLEGEFQKDMKRGTIDGNDFELDLLELKPGSYHLIHNNKSYNIEVLKADTDEKQYILNINGTKHVVDVQEERRLSCIHLTLNKQKKRISSSCILLKYSFGSVFISNS